MFLAALVAFHTAMLGNNVPGNGGNGVKLQLAMWVTAILPDHWDPCLAHM